MAVCHHRLGETSLQRRHPTQGFSNRQRAGLVLSHTRLSPNRNRGSAPRFKPKGRAKRGTPLFLRTQQCVSSNALLLLLPQMLLLLLAASSSSSSSSLAPQTPSRKRKRASSERERRTLREGGREASSLKIERERESARRVGSRVEGGLVQSLQLLDFDLALVWRWLGACKAASRVETRRHSALGERFLIEETRGEIERDRVAPPAARAPSRA